MENRTIKFRVAVCKNKIFDHFNYHELETGKSYSFGNCHFMGDYQTKHPQQFTGLIDCNKKEIYEGDIVRVNSQGEIPCFDKKDFEVISYTYIGTVCFKDGCFVIQKFITGEKLLELQKLFDDFTMDSDIEVTIDSELKIEVIGNIYETPEKLKEYESK